MILHLINILVTDRKMGFLNQVYKFSSAYDVIMTEMGEAIYPSVVFAKSHLVICMMTTCFVCVITE